MLPAQCEHFQKHCFVQERRKESKERGGGKKRKKKGSIRSRAPMEEDVQPTGVWTWALGRLHHTHKEIRIKWAACMRAAYSA